SGHSAPPQYVEFLRPLPSGKKDARLRGAPGEFTRPPVAHRQNPNRWRARRTQKRNVRLGPRHLLRLRPRIPLLRPGRFHLAGLPPPSRALIRKTQDLPRRRRDRREDVKNDFLRVSLRALGVSALNHSR